MNTPGTAMKLFTRISLPVTLTLSLIGASLAAPVTPPWGDAKVHEVVKIHGCTVYALDSDPDNTFWTICDSN